jgi:hypothetical protein
MMDSAFTLNPDINKTDLDTTAMIATAITIRQTNIAGSGGTDTIIGTITIETMIATTTAIDSLRFLSDHERTRLCRRITTEK